MLLIPAIDLRGGRCVRLYQGDFAAETRYELLAARAIGEVPLTRRFLGARRRSRRRTGRCVGESGSDRRSRFATGAQTAGRRRRQIAPKSSKTSSRAGSSESLSAARRWNGPTTSSTGRAASERTASVWRSTFATIRTGSRRCALAAGEQEPRPLSGRRSRTIRRRRVRHVLCTDIERDGALTGPNLELYRRAIQRFPRIAWQASGGVRDAADLAALAGIGATAAVSGKALLEERISPEELRPFLPDASFPASTSATARS